MKKAYKSIEKIAKKLTFFCNNKPNSPIVQMNLTYFTIMNYAFFISLTKVKNKPNSNPIFTLDASLTCFSVGGKANSNPKVCPEHSRMGQNKSKTNPYEPNLESLLSALTIICITAILVVLSFYVENDVKIGKRII